MTPEEAKAKELYNKFFEYAYVPWNGGENECTQEEAAKECALICVEEIIDVVEENHAKSCVKWPLEDYISWQYWNKVKTHLINS